ncbi:MAG: biotin--[acetyl-CoA-carboxylase] ligase [Bacteroidota bacterium]
MYTVPRNTRKLGKNLIFKPEIPSTNAQAVEFAKRGEITDGTVVITAHQSAGKGQAGTTWSSQPNLNLTFSVYLEDPLPATDAFNLNIIATLAVADVCARRGLADVKVKWPNDVLLTGKKVSGILCENSIQGDRVRYAVIGIGLNVNQKLFDGFSATSLASASGRTIELNMVFHELMERLEHRFDQLKAGEQEGLRSEWLSRLLLYRELHTFNTVQGPLTGFISGIDGYGRLMIETGQGTRIFGPKEITP